MSEQRTEDDEQCEAQAPLPITDLSAAPHLLTEEGVMRAGPISAYRRKYPTRKSAGRTARDSTARCYTSASACDEHSWCWQCRRGWVKSQCRCRAKLKKVQQNSLRQTSIESQSMHGRRHRRSLPESDRKLPVRVPKMNPSPTSRARILRRKSARVSFRNCFKGIARKCLLDAKPERAMRLGVDVQSVYQTSAQSRLHWMPGLQSKHRW